MQGPGYYNPISEKTGYSVLNGDAPISPNDSRHGKIPVEHMTYPYIASCKDVRYLEKILTRLGSGAEGAFPDLVRHCEDHLRRLDPRNQSLRKDNPVARLSSVPEDLWSELTAPPQYWDEKKRQCEATLKEPPKWPPIRSPFSIPLGQSPQLENSPKKAVPRDSRDWDKFDVEKECEKVDADVTTEDPSAVACSGRPKIQSTVDTKSQTLHHENLANDERNKGNDAYRAGDYSKALIYYSRSIAVTPTVTAYSNKALAHVKQEDWHSAMGDCQKALALEPGNAKALYCRAKVHKNLRNFAMAAEDLRSLLREHPKERETIKLLAEVEEKIREGESENLNKGKKILIEEENDDDSGEDTFASLKQEGNDFVKNGQYQDAVAKYSRCLEMTPNDPVVYGNRAHCYLKLERFAEAKQDCDVSLGLDKVPKTMYRRAMAHKGLRDYPACIYDLRALLRCDPNNWAAEKELAEVLVSHLTNVSASPAKHRRVVPLADVEGDEEMEDMEIGSIDGCPTTVPSPSRLDTEKEREKNVDSGDVTMEEEEEGEPPAVAAPAWLDEQALARAVQEKDRGNEAYRDGLYAQALADYSRSIDVVPTAVAFNNRAQALIKLRRWGDAMSDCQAVLEQEPRNLKALLRRAEVRRNLGDFPEALEDLTLVLGEVPHNPAANRLLDRVESDQRSKLCPSYIS